MSKVIRIPDDVYKRLMQIREQTGLNFADTLRLVLRIDTLRITFAKTKKKRGCPNRD